MKKMSIGETIKSIAIVVGVVGILVSLIWGVSLFENYKPWKDDLPIGAIVLFGGSICSLISASLMYGFGHLICQVDALVEIGESKQNDNPDKHSDIKSSTNNNDQQKYHSNRNDIDGDFYRKDKNSNDDYLESEDDETFGEDFDYDTSIPKVYCPECGTKHDFDCPKCPNCGHKYKF